MSLMGVGKSRRKGKAVTMCMKTCDKCVSMSCPRPGLATQKRHKTQHFILLIEIFVTACGLHITEPLFEAMDDILSVRHLGRNLSAISIKIQNFKQQLGCRFDIMDNESFFVCVLTYAIINVLIILIRSFFGFTFLNILCFLKYSCTNIFHRRSLYAFYQSFFSRKVNLICLI